MTMPLTDAQHARARLRPPRARPALVAQRRDLPGLRAQLRRRRRRRHRRPARRAQPARAISRNSASTRSGSTRGTRRPSPTAATTSRDYRDIHPAFGTLEDAELLIAEALELGIRTIIDVVPNHVSSEHRWFQAALAAGPGSPERERFWFHPGKGPNGDEMPTQLGLELPGRHVDAHDEPRRRAGGVVPAPVHARAARPQLEPPRRARASTRTSCGSGSTAASPACASTPPPCSSRTRRCPRCPTIPRPGEHPHRGPRRGARRLPRVAAHRRLLRRARACSSARSGCPMPQRFAALPPARRDAHRVQLRLHGAPVGRRRAARLDRPHARRARAGRRAEHLGALEPRRDPAGHPLRPRGLELRLREEAVRHPDRSRRSAPAALAPPRC